MSSEIHVAIMRTVKPGREEEFERSLRTFFGDALKERGTLGALLLRPLPGSGSRTFGIVRSFGSEEDRGAFYESETFRKWAEAVQPLVEGAYSRVELHGLEAFFDNPALIRHPPRWKMAIATWLGVWPTSYAVSMLIARPLSGMPRILASGIGALLIVAILTWAVMPVLTRLMRPWLK